MRRLLAGAVISACALACASDPGEPRASAAAAITHGDADAGDPAVVAIIDARGEITCTGTIVAAHVVLTAAHCITPLVARGAIVAFGPSGQAPTTTIPIVAVNVHPAFDPTTFANDLALLAIASASPVAPVALARGHAPAVGDSVRVVGYGASTGGGAKPDGPKRQGTSRVTAVSATKFDAAPSPSQPCEGDSGGPAFASTAGVDAISGVVSHGDGACSDHSDFTRIDAYLDGFIAPAMAAWADGTAAAGERCLFPEHCRGGASSCVTPPDSQAARYCTAACDANADCPRGMSCVRDGDSGSRCHYLLPTPGALGSACASDDDCADGQCASGVCTLRCVPGEIACPGSFVCANTSGIDFFCVAGASPSVRGGSCAMARGDARFAVIIVGALAAALARRRAHTMARCRPCADRARRS